MNELLQKIDELKLLALGRSDQRFAIGIGITTHNRYDVFLKTLKEIKRYAPINAKIVVVDDASDSPVAEATFRFNKNVGIARAKNKCLELLYNAGCEHFFLFDDDCYPISDNWYYPYIESKEPHLNYIFVEFRGENIPKMNDTLLLYKDREIKAYSHARGCMCYYKRVCLDVCGGMSPIYGKWGYEHPDLSNRIYNAGLTSFRYMDVLNSDKLIYSRDEHTGNADSTVQGDDRSVCISKNSVLYNARKDTVSEYVEFREKENIVLAALFTTLSDPQRNTSMKPDKSILKPLMDSMKGQKLIILNDCFENETKNNIQFVKVETSLSNVYYQRWVSYYRYLIEHKENLNKVFIVDATDVEMINNPFNLMESGKIYVGDEAERTGCEWMVKNHPHELIQACIRKNAARTLINCGLFGSDVDNVIAFIGKFLSFYFASVHENHFNGTPDCGLFEMGLFNYIARTHYNDQLVHGTQVNTVFKSEQINPVSFFKHK